MEFSNKTYVVTGASSGIGAATARALGLRGANVVLAARRLDLCGTIAADIEQAGGRALALRCDVTREEDIRATIAQTVEHFGRLDGAVNNAGQLGHAAPLHETATADFETIMAANVTSVFWSMRYQIAAMLPSGGGAIVNVASIAAHVGFAQVAPYVASKHAVLGLTRTAALEYFGKGIRINAVSPGPIATPMAEIGFGSLDNLNATMTTSPAGRAGIPAEIAASILYLLSNAASYVSGQALVADGGWTVA
ncbi:SDR family NAD(P)-dependent oxidoreductase [Bradyrhizobium sp. UFLA05-112]